MGRHFSRYLIHLVMSTMMLQAHMVVEPWQILWIIEWLNEWGGRDISVMELVLVFAAAALCGGVWQGHHICFHSDNMAVVSVLNMKTATSPLLIHLHRCLSFYCAHHHFHIIIMCAGVARSTNSQHNFRIGQ